MHKTSHDHMAGLVRRHLPRFRSLEILDIGSSDVNGSYRALFARRGWRYTGVDLAAGPNVDLVLPSPYELPLASGAVDVIVSGQAFEHVEYFWLLWLEMVRVLKPGGLIFLIAPSRGPEHRYPVDCWRFYPDGYRALAKYGGVEMLDVTTDWAPDADIDSAQWGDTVGVFRKASPRPRVGQRVHDTVSAILRSLGSGRRRATAPVGSASAAPSAAPPARYVEDASTLRLDHVLKVMQSRILGRTSYLGVPTQKNPLDLWVYQELIFQHQPDVIVEIGNRFGGSTLALANLCDLVGRGRIIGIDIDHASVPDRVRRHPRISLLEGDACRQFPNVRQAIRPADDVMVIEDSSHTYENTLNVLRTYSPLIKPGGYFIVEDGICHHGLDEGPRPGPYEAVEAFVAENGRFAIERGHEDFLITWNPKGFLKRVK
ncbi:MAG TPA: class I SAM-dependent methyltransferase [Thermoleophilaceae bacterium]